MLAATFGMIYFNEHLQGIPFLLLMDEKPVPELTHLHKKTLARFQASMDNYQFILQQKVSAKVPTELKAHTEWAINFFGP